MSTLSLFLLMACGGSTEAPAPEPEPVEAAAPEAEAVPEAPPEPTGRVFFVEPADGATVSSPVKVVMGVEGMKVAPAGTMDAGTGHHHVIIGPAGVERGTVVPADEKHIHFGQGQTEAEVELQPGEHKLTLQFADGTHTSFGEPLATTITITVE